MAIKRNLTLKVLLFLSVALFRADAVFAQELVVDPAAVIAKRAELEADLQALESQIEDLRQTTAKLQGERSSLERDIALLDAQIKQAQLTIKARALTINKLQAQIEEKTGIIGALGDKYEREKESLGEMMRQLNELSDVSEVEIVLKYKNLADYFGRTNSLDNVQKGIQGSFDEIKVTKRQTEEERTALEDRKQEESDLREIQLLEKRRIEERENEKKKILKETRGKEKEYKSILTGREKDAAKIRGQLFMLRGSAAIPFEKALELANKAMEKTGVRPALILGILREESNLGQNVGTGSWRVDMKSPRDTEPFLDITSRLGLNPDSMPVSKKPWYGWGGAMGPAQFIPSTWVLYEKRLGELTGHNPPNPWDPGDGIMASALLLKDNGAAKGTYGAERTAALCYLAGCKNANKKAYAFYGDDVMSFTADYQEQIDILSGGR